MKNTTYGKLTAGLIAGWFAFALSASAVHLFRTDPSRPPLSLLLAVVIPILVFVSWYRTSKSFRDFVLSLNPQMLTAVQAWRIDGFAFLALYRYGILPGIFALPAGWGDIAIGATALIVARNLANPSHRKSFILWQLLGMADLTTAITLGAVARFISPQEFGNALGVTTAPMTVLPLSLIPTFAVPLMLILHVICIAQARQWSQETSSLVAKRAGSFA